MQKDDIAKLVKEVLSQQKTRPDSAAKVKTAAAVSAPLLVAAMLFNTYFMPMVSADTHNKVEMEMTNHVTQIHNRLDSRLNRMEQKIDRLIERR